MYVFMYVYVFQYPDVRSTLYLKSNIPDFIVESIVGCLKY